MTSMISTLRTQLGGFRAMAAGTADASRLPLFHEDMHWLLLIIGQFFAYLISRLKKVEIFQLYNSRVHTFRLDFSHYKSHKFCLQIIIIKFPANTVVGEECEGGCHTAAEIYENSAAIVNQQRGGASFDDNAKATFLELCLNDPNFDRAPWEMQVDPFIL